MLMLRWANIAASVLLAFLLLSVQHASSAYHTLGDVLHWYSHAAGTHKAYLKCVRAVHLGVFSSLHEQVLLATMVDVQPR